MPGRTSLTRRCRCIEPLTGPLHRAGLRTRHLSFFRPLALQPHKLGLRTVCTALKDRPMPFRTFKLIPLFLALGGAQNGVQTGDFNAYGLSTTATVPWF